MKKELGGVTEEELRSAFSKWLLCTVIDTSVDPDIIRPNETVLRYTLDNSTLALQQAGRLSKLLYKNNIKGVFIGSQIVYVPDKNLSRLIGVIRVTKDAPHDNVLELIRKAALAEAPIGTTLTIKVPVEGRSEQGGSEKFIAKPNNVINVI